MIILGLDPGTATTGFGIIRVDDRQMSVVDFGLIETSKDKSPEYRLSKIFRAVETIIARHSPNVMAIEKVFFSANAKTAIRVGQAQGVMLLSAAFKSVPVVEYAPGSIKKIVTGSGRADKKVVHEAVKKILGAKVYNTKLKKTHIDNAIDALAIAICHIYQSDFANVFQDTIDDAIYGKR